MNDKSFVDSNVWIYLFDKDQSKKKVSLQLLCEETIISTQVIAENINVCFRKFNLPFDVVENHAMNLIQNCQVALISPATIQSALQISKRYQYRFYDSLILATALENDCPIVYSEDMQHEQVIEGNMTILNPFLPGVL